MSDGHYRKVSVEIWSDDKFRKFSNHGKLAFLFVLTHPQMTSLGAMRASTEGLAADIGWKHKAFRDAFAEASAEGMILAAKEPLIVVPNFIKHNPPQSVNVVRSWGKIIPTLPKCKLLLLHLQEVKAYLDGMHDSFGKAYRKPYEKACGMPLLIQEQEGEQEGEQETDKKDHASQAPHADNGSPEKPVDEILYEFPLRAKGKTCTLTKAQCVRWRERWGDIIVVQDEVEAAVDWCIERKRVGQTRKLPRSDGHAFIMNWLKGAVEDAESGTAQKQQETENLEREQRIKAHVASSRVKSEPEKT